LIDKIEDENRYEEIKNTLDDYLRVFENPGVGEDAIIGMIKHFAAPTYRDDRQKEQWVSDRKVEGWYPDWQRYVQSKVEDYGITTEQSTKAESVSRESPAPTADSKGTGESNERTPSIPTLSRSTQ
jgi:hypothetical protein